MRWTWNNQHFNRWLTIILRAACCRLLCQEWEDKLHEMAENITTYQLVATWWFGTQWFGFLRSPYEREFLLQGSQIESQSTGPQTTKPYHYLDVPDRKLGSMVRISGWFLPPKNQYTPFISRWNNPIVSNPLILTLCSGHVELRDGKMDQSTMVANKRSRSPMRQ